MEKDNLIVVTGAGGFIGGNLVKSLANRGFCNIRAVDIKPKEQWYQIDKIAKNIDKCDLKEKENCYSVCNDAFEIYNLAADMGGLGFIESHKTECMLSVLINTHMLMAARDVGKVERYLYSSSACAYNVKLQTNAITALKESDAYPADAEDGYGWEKLFSERMCRHFREDYGIPTRIARFHNVYGPNGTWDGGREKAPAAICRKIIQSVVEGEKEIEIWGDGEQTRSFMYIDDCLEGVDILTHSDFVDPLNIGSSELVSINQLVDYVEQIANVKLKRNYNLNAPKGVRGRNSDNTLIKKIFNWEPSTTLYNGLTQTYNWIKTQYELRKSGESVVE